jgi:LacI family transcriptional regulator
MAMGVLLATRELGLHCPEDVSIVGFDDLDFAEFTAPALTSVHQPGYQIGTTAARLLLDRIDGSREPPKKIAMPSELRIRHSVVCLSTTVPPASSKQREAAFELR